MNAQRTIFGLSIILLFIASTATAQASYPGSCCEWGRTSPTADWSCIGNCVTGTCVQTGPTNCSCQTQPDCDWIEEDTFVLRDVQFDGGGYCGGFCPYGQECVGGSHECWCQTTTTSTTTSSTTTTSTTTTSTTTTTEPPEDCGWHPIFEGTQEVQGTEGYCEGYCSNGGTCVPSEAVGAAACYCKPPVPVPEFATGAVALIVMLLSPAFAYLAVRRRH